MIQDIYRTFLRIYDTKYKLCVPVRLWLPRSQTLSGEVQWASFHLFDVLVQFWPSVCHATLRSRRQRSAAWQKGPELDKLRLEKFMQHLLTNQSKDFASANQVQNQNHHVTFSRAGHRLHVFRVFYLFYSFRYLTSSSDWLIHYHLRPHGAVIILFYLLESSRWTLPFPLNTALSIDRKTEFRNRTTLTANPIYRVQSEST